MRSSEDNQAVPGAAGLLKLTIETSEKRGTGILPVSGTAVPAVHKLLCSNEHEQDARATHGRDAHATPAFQRSQLSMVNFNNPDGSRRRLVIYASTSDLRPPTFDLRPSISGTSRLPPIEPFPDRRILRKDRPACPFEGAPVCPVKQTLRFLAYAAATPWSASAAPVRTTRSGTEGPRTILSIPNRPGSTPNAAKSVNHSPSDQ